MKALSVAGAILLSVATTELYGQPAPASSSIDAGLVMREIQALGFTGSTVDQDASGNPRVNTAVDGHRWAIYFHDCAAGALEQRQCQWFSFVAETDMRQPVPIETINKWHKEYRYARADIQQGNDAGCQLQLPCTARIEVDILMKGTAATPADMFRAYFALFRRRAASFRKYIGAPE